jgi:tetratricopeptide (TPR) repeat protein
MRLRSNRWAAAVGAGLGVLLAGARPSDGLRCGPRPEGSAVEGGSPSRVGESARSGLRLRTRPDRAPRDDGLTKTESSDFQELAERARTAHAAGKLDEARGLYEQALRLDPDWSEGRFSLGTVLYGLDLHDDARAAFRRVVAESPESGPALAFKGLCEFELGKLERALGDLQQARDLGLGRNSELESVASYHAAILLTRFGHFELAHEILKGFVRREQDSPSLIEALGLAVLRLPYLPSEAPVQKRELIRMAGRAGYLMARSRQSPSTRRALEILVDRFPEEPNVRYAWATHLLSDEPGAAIAEYRRVLRMDPAHVPARLQIALQLIKEGRYREAVPPAQQAVEIDPESFAARNALGRALLGAGEIGRAITELEIGARLAPDSPQMLFHLARAYQLAGRTEEAEDARAAFIELDRRRRDALKDAATPEE